MSAFVVRKAGLAAAGVVLVSQVASASVTLDPSFGVSLSGNYRTNARYRLSNTNWDQIITTSPFVAPSNIVQSTNIANHTALNSKVWDFAYRYTAGSGYEFALSDGVNTYTDKFFGTHTDGSSATSPYNAIELYVVAGAGMPTGTTNAFAKAYDLNFAFIGGGPSVSGSLRNLQDTWTAGVNTGLDQQLIYSDTDLSMTTWALTGKVQLGYTGWTSGNFDERLKFNIKTFEAIPAPSSLALLGGFGLIAVGRRRR